MNLRNIIVFVALICVTLTCEILAISNSNGGIRAYETFISRGLVTLILAVWYFKMQEPPLTTLHWNFLLTLLIPFMIGFSRYLLPDYLAIIAITFFYLSSYILWILLFKNLGAKLNISKFPVLDFILILFIFSIPYLYYFIVLFPMLQNINIILVFLFAIFISITSVIVLFLPKTKYISGRYFLIFGIWLAGFTHMMESYYHFNNEGLFIYPFARILQTSSLIFLLVGMTEYCKQNSRIVTEN